jgi:hypothetical protein
MKDYGICQKADRILAHYYLRTTLSGAALVHAMVIVAIRGALKNYKVAHVSACRMHGIGATPS